MKTSCPNCGAEIEFRYDDSFVRICSHCNHAVERTDRGLETLGKVADLAPIESPLRLFSEGHFGSTSFLLVGMAQIRHAQGGIWQEWYAKFDTRWGWLAEAQGRYYLTFHEPDWKPIDLRALAPGHVVDLPVRGTPHAMTVAEATSGTFVSARGELPYKLVPDETFHYADLSDGKGTFATIDYGDGDAPPALYVGVQVPLADLKLTGGEVAPQVAEPTIRSKRLACPNCNAPIELHAPDQSQRAVCTHCNALLDTSSGELAVLGVLKQKPQLQIPLGSKGHFVDGELIVIGYLQRSALVGGTWWPFEEYLLYRSDLGFRWLVESDGHWSYIQPVATGAVSDAAAPVYDKVKFRSFQSAELRVDQVFGEVYWQVKVGETVSSDDYVAPPAMLSREVSQTEEDWSLGTYLTAHEVEAAFAGTAIALGPPIGIAPNQPDPWTAASSVMSIAFLVLLLVGIVFSLAAKDDRKLDQDLTFTSQAPPAPTAATTDPLSNPALTKSIDDQLADLNKQILSDPLGSGSGIAITGSAAGSASAASDSSPNVIFSDPIAIDGRENIELQFRANTLTNNWVYVAADLVEQASGQVVNLEANLEYYAGVDDGDSWSEGSRDASVVVGPQPPGSYIIRFEGQTGAGTETVHVQLRQGVFRGQVLVLAMLALGLPLALVGLISYLHEKRRWENSTSGKPPFTPVGLIVLMFAGVFLIIAALIKRSSND